MKTHVTLLKQKCCSTCIVTS